MSPAMKVLALFVAAGITVGTAALSRVPTELHPHEGAVLRLSWRMDGVSAEKCEAVSAEEMAKRPIHMRSTTECRGHIASYALIVRVDGVVVDEEIVLPPGARGDRPVTVLRELPLAVGRHDVDLTFEAVMPDGAEVSEGIVSLAWSGAVDVQDRTVVLVSLDDAGRELVRRERP